jgi:chorismate mutase
MIDPMRSPTGPLNAGLGVLLAPLLGLLLTAGCAVSPATPGVTPDPALARLVGLAGDRLATADTVAATKWLGGGSIYDPARETAVLDAAATGSTERGLDPRDAQAVFRDQIEANKAVQYGLFSEWSADPGRAPTAAPDLSGVRPVLDSITPGLLDGLRAAAPQRSDADCRVEVSGLVAQEAGRRGLDDLHRHALDRAVRSLCR